MYESKIIQSLGYRGQIHLDNQSEKSYNDLGA